MWIVVRILARICSKILEIEDPLEDPYTPPPYTSFIQGSLRGSSQGSSFLILDFLKDPLEDPYTWHSLEITCEDPGGILIPGTHLLKDAWEDLLKDPDISKILNGLILYIRLEHSPNQE